MAKIYELTDVQIVAQISKYKNKLLEVPNDESYMKIHKKLLAEQKKRKLIQCRFFVL